MDKSFNYIISPEISEFRKFSPKLKIGVLASGKGTNFQELINLSKKGELDIDIKVLITNKDDAGCIKRAESGEIPHKIIRGKDFSQKELFELEIINTLVNYDVELVVMAGWMKIVSPFFINRFKNKIINIHPSLLPAYKGGSAIKDSLLNCSKITSNKISKVIVFTKLLNSFLIRLALSNQITKRPSKDLTHESIFNWDDPLIKQIIRT